MNILILNWRDPRNPKSGGAEIVTMEHAKAWVKKGHKVTWFTSSFKKNKKKETIDGVDIIRKGNSVLVYAYAPFFYLKNRKKFDFVVDEIHGLPFFTPLYVGKPKIAFIHEVADKIWDYMYPFPINKMGKKFESFYFNLYKNTKFWIDAKSTAEDLKKFGIKTKNCFPINCPINNKSLTKLPRKEKKPTYIFVSRVVKMKGIEEVIRAFFYILRGQKNARLWIIGHGEKKYVEELRENMKLYSIAPKVKFWGRVSEGKKLELMRKAHILLHASVKEGWGLVVVEAASQGTPSVVYNVSGLKDSVKNGKTGIVLNKNNPKKMAEESLKLLKNKRKYIGFQKQCIKWANSLTWEKATTQSEALLLRSSRGN